MSTIAGIPAEEFIGRRVKFWGSQSSKQHAVPCLIMSIHGNKAQIKPIGHKREETVYLSAIVPVWKFNDDLRQKYAKQIPVEAAVDVEEPEPETPAIITMSESHEEPPEEITLPQPDPMPDPQPDPQPAIRQPRMIIHRHSTEWLPLYQEYLSALQSEAADRELLREVEESIAASRHRQNELVALLKQTGVEIQDDGVEDTTAEPDDIHKRRGRIANDQHILDWGRQLRERIKNGEEIVGTVNSWADELNVTHRTLQTRVDMLQRVLKLVFTDADGRTGGECRGATKVTYNP